MESFFGTLKTELVYHRNYETRKEAQSDIFEYFITVSGCIRPWAIGALSLMNNWSKPLNPVSTISGKFHWTVGHASVYCV